jgi:hypothetical protein
MSTFSCLQFHFQHFAVRHFGLRQKTKRPFFCSFPGIVSHLGVALTCQKVSVIFEICIRLRACQSAFKSRIGLPDFSWYNVPKLGKIYQMTTKLPKCPLNIQYGCKIFQMDKNIQTLSSIVYPNW